jgi:hypothetical protein
MVKLNKFNKRKNSCFLVFYRKKGWQKLYQIMSRKNIANKINMDTWNDLSIEKKKNFLRSVKSEYMGYLICLGMEKSEVMKTKSYLLLNGICNFKTKTLNNHESVKSSWMNLRVCALNHE